MPITKNTSIGNRFITMLLAVAAAVILPQIFHGIGVLSGAGAVPGTVFLPMHIPVIIAGLMGGPVVGIVAGVLSPIISFGFTNMPGIALLPFVTIELAGYGLVGGLLSKSGAPVFGKLVITQLAGRALRILAVLCAYVFLSYQDISQIWGMIISGLPGIILQWAFIPLLMYRLDGKVL